MNETKSRIIIALNEYWKRRKKWKPTEGAFTVEDVKDIIDNAEFKEKTCYVQDALFAGFIVGYRKGLKDAKK